MHFINVEKRAFFLDIQFILANMAEGIAMTIAPSLLVLGGFSGSGKSTLAKFISHRNEFKSHIIIDQIRRDPRS